jgi:hypothetical protein
LLSILKTKQNKNNEHINFNGSINQPIKDENINIGSNINKDLKTDLLENDYINTTNYPHSTKEWYNSIYAYNKSYVKSLITLDNMLNFLFKSYFNMLEYKIRILKRRRTNKIRYMSDKIFISRAELKHTNTKLTVILYTFNKQKLSIEQFINRVIIFTEKKNKLNKKTISKKIHENTNNKLVSLLKHRVFYFKKWKNPFLKITGNFFKYIGFNSEKSNISVVKNNLIEENILYNYAKQINFNKGKFSNFFLNIMGIGLINLIQRMYNKELKIKLVELKSISLNSDIFSSAVALKLRDRKNNAVSILKKAILHMVKIPSLHTLITFDDNIEKINKNNILNIIKQQVVSGVRFEASGRLTRRLTALRAVFKVRYAGSLKDVRSSLNNKSSTILRGHVKSNSQYTIINSKTRNGTFGLKGWVSSH